MLYFLYVSITPHKKAEKKGVFIKGSSFWFSFESVTSL